MINQLMKKIITSLFYQLKTYPYKYSLLYILKSNNITF